MNPDPKSPIPLLVKVGFPVAVFGLVLMMYGPPIIGLLVYTIGFLVALVPRRE